ncbi:Dihydroorotate dehydrogenase B (NAD(+)), electron transfer subunit [Candidatus Izimaplasma bacterium HR1]|jgi:dihydroorotate dehydrogenase electron transfer subunit|uniref:dihydroorotate dehydrogenase electron transfer subunit n=1 Tax=Candidatus Izimoplasma sp. HR1 TaxID=1541959 RepID=UPI0004F7D6F2|nr:Dihydroorotate dehydrogenase B (NAD(+)), electron transfer subunit [Candidatus Izimaplasma bacterium HR1]
MSNYKVLSNTLIAYKTYEMRLFGNTEKITNPGQFLNIKIDDSYQAFLRRPISISKYKENEITIIYKVFGEGTDRLSKKKFLDVLDILSPLGNGFTVLKEHEKVLLIGGGVGVPPLIGVALELKKNNIKFDAVLGFNNQYDVFKESVFNALAENTYIATMDGSYGYKGNVVDVIKQLDIEFDYYYSCGPEPMLHALVKEGYEGQLSFEERMGCGFGACMGCTHKTIDSYKRICKEGPVLESKEVYII